MRCSGDHAHAIVAAPIPLFQAIFVTAQVAVVLGPTRAGKTHELLGRYREALAEGRTGGLDRVLWLAPSSRSVTAVRDQFIDRGVDACLSPGITTFDDLADAILSASKNKTRPITPVLQRELLRRVIERAVEDGALEYFTEAAHRSGFVDQLALHIRELKRHDIGPQAYERIATSRDQPPQHQELARLYADYERRLTSDGLVDRESIQLAARDALANNSCQRFQQLDLIVVDGFTDLTRTQHEILHLLATRAHQLIISLPADTDPTNARADLFAKTAATLAELNQYHPRLELQRLAPRPSASPALDHLARNIFRHPKPAATADVLASLNQIEIIEAAGTQDEIVQIARRIKSLLAKTPLPFGEGQRDGSAAAALVTSKPGEIVVIFRSVAEVAPRIEEVFDRFGIPYSLEASPRIARAAIFKTLVALLRLDQEDWPFRRVVSILTNNTLAALPATARQSADWLVRDLQVASGRRKLSEIVEGLAAQQGSASGLSEHQQRRIQAAAAALPALAQIVTALDKLPNEATLAEWTAALASFGTLLALSPFVEPAANLRTGRISDQFHAATDLAAWQAITTHFAALERLDTWLGEPPRKLSRSDLLATLIDVATHETLPRTHDDVGRVRVLSAQSARATTVRHLFLAGMSEQSFPSPLRPGRLATDSEYRFFANAAHQPANQATQNAPAATRAQDEMLLFYEVLSRAAETLTISYPALDDKAQELPPSPYVVELKRMFAEAVPGIHCSPPQLSPVPQSRSAEPRQTLESECRSAPGTYCVADWRVRAVANALATDGNSHLLAGLFSRNDTRSLGQAIDAGLRTVHARAHGDAFGPSEGLLTSPAVAARLAKRFGPQHLWSPSQWETYAACPFKFYLEAVLKLEPLGDLVLETDFSRRGSRLHHVLATFHRQWLEQPGPHPLNADEEQSQFFAHLCQVIDQRIAVSPQGGIDAALLELDRRQIRKWAKRHFDNHVKYDRGCGKRGATMTPAHFEFRFGSSRSGESDTDPDSSKEAFVLDIGGEPIRVTGQIDRVDVGTIGGKTVFNVIDYKSGRRAGLKPQQIETGQQLQLPIYVEAAQILLFQGDATPLAAGYWSMAGGFDEKGALAVPPEGKQVSHWDDTHSKVHTLIRTFVDAIRHGDFPVASRDDKCTSYCDFNLVCRVSQARSTGKTWWPEPT